MTEALRAPGVVADHSHLARTSPVDVDVETGKVILRRLIAVDDCGRILNPLIAEGRCMAASRTAWSSTRWRTSVFVTSRCRRHRSACGRRSTTRSTATRPRSIERTEPDCGGSSPMTSSPTSRTGSRSRAATSSSAGSGPHCGEQLAAPPVYHVDIDGDRASALTYHTSHQTTSVASDRVTLLVARYRDELRRVGDSWKIASKTMEPVGARSDRHEPRDGRFAGQRPR